MDSTMIALIPIVTSLALFAMIVIIAISNNNSRKERARMQADVQNRLIDKFGSAPEFINFLASPAGRSFMNGFEAQPRLMAGDRILRGVKAATVLSFLGIAFLIIAAVEERELLIPGFILLGLGGGYVFSSILMVRLSRSWGLMDAKHPEDAAPESITRQ